MSLLSELFVIMVTQAETLLSVDKHLQMWGGGGNVALKMGVKHKSASATSLHPACGRSSGSWQVSSPVCVHACPCTGIHGWRQALEAGNCRSTPALYVGKPSVCLLGLRAEL